MIKEIIRKIPFINTLALKFYCKINKIPRLSSSANYWEERYKYGYNSGKGSYGNLAEFKAEEINTFIEKNKINSVIEFGCGDGNQLQYYNFKNYIGFDVSKTVVRLCKEKFSQDTNKQFFHTSDYKGQIADLAISIDVIFHLFEKDVFEEHLNKLFSASNKFVIIYSSNTERYNTENITHERHWEFTKWIDSNIITYELMQKIPNKFPYKEGDENTSFADFYIYKKTI